MVGWRNNKTEDYVGSSFGYSKTKTSVGTTNGAGPHNVQMFVLSPDLVVLHALPGFWHPEDLTRELRFAQVLARLWQDETRTHQRKSALFERMQLSATRTHAPETFARSGWQGFDAAIEKQKLQNGGCDTFLLRENGQPLRDQAGRPLMKPLNVLVHERMAQRPFVPFEDFDIAAFFVVTLMASSENSE